MAVIVEAADQRDVQPGVVEFFTELYDPLGGVFIIDRDTDDFGPGEEELFNLLESRVNIRGVGIRHGLHDDRRIAAHGHVADMDRYSLVTFYIRQGDHGPVIA